MWYRFTEIVKSSTSKLNFGPYFILTPVVQLQSCSQGSNSKESVCGLSATVQLFGDKPDICSKVCENEYLIFAKIIRKLKCKLVVGATCKNACQVFTTLQNINH